MKPPADGNRNRLPATRAEPPGTGPVPARHGHKHPRPLEARTNWGPWLPATEAYPYIPRPLRGLALVVLVVMLLLTLALLWLGP